MRVHLARPPHDPATNAGRPDQNPHSSSSDAAGGSPTQAGTLILVGGGTGGHVFPAVATAQAWNDLHGGRLPKPILLTDARGYRFAQKDTRMFQDVIVLPDCKPWTVGAIIVRCWRLLRHMRPRACIGFGGQMTVVPLMVARGIGCRTAVHQSDVVWGKANRFLARIVNARFCAFPPKTDASIPSKTMCRWTAQAHCIGMPLRSLFQDNCLRASQDDDEQLTCSHDSVPSWHDLIRSTDREGSSYGDFSGSQGNSKEKAVGSDGSKTGPQQPPSLGPAGLSTNSLQVLVLGGSQGAHVWTMCLPDALRRLSPPLRTQIIIRHQARPEDVANLECTYAEQGVQAHVAPFFPDIAAELRGCDVVLARAGAGTICEIGWAGKPSLLVPYPHAGGHQILNAQHVVDQGAGWMCLQQDLQDTHLAQFLYFCLYNKEKITHIGRRAFQNIYHPHASHHLTSWAF